MPPRRLVVALRQGDELLGQPLCLLRLGVGGTDRLLLDERRDQVAEQGLSVRRVAAQCSELHVPARQPRRRRAECTPRLHFAMRLWLPLSPCGCVLRCVWVGRSIRGEELVVGSFVVLFARRSAGWCARLVREGLVPSVALAGHDFSGRHGAGQTMRGLYFSAGSTSHVHHRLISSASSSF